MNMLPTVRRQLLEAVERRAQPIPRRRRRLGPGHIVTATLVALPVLIAALALVMLGARRAAPSKPPAAHPETARRQLIEHFAVLRQAQTPADRDSQLLLPPFSGRRSGDPKLDQTLMRVVSVPRFDAKVAFEPVTWQPSLSSPRRSEGLELVMRIGSARTIPPASEDGTGPITIASLLARGLLLTAVRPGAGSIVGVMAVPDSVARVTLRPIRLLRTPVQVDVRTFGAATATVRDNVAAYQLRVPTVHGPRSWVTGLFGTGGEAEVTWFDAAGNVIKRTTTRLELFIRLVGGDPQTAKGGASSR